MNAKSVWSVFLPVVTFVLALTIQLVAQQAGFDPTTPGANCATIGCVTTYHNDNAPGNAIVWAVNTAQYGLYNPVNGGSVQPAGASVLYGYAAVPTGQNCSTSACTITEYFKSSSLSAVPNGPGAVKFTVPTVAGGMVFVAGGAGPTSNGTRTGYVPGPTGFSGGGNTVNCSPTATSGTCAGYLFVYGSVAQ